MRIEEMTRDLLSEKDAEIERLRATLEDIGAAQWGMDVATLRRIAREALGANEQSALQDCRWEIGISRIDGSGIDWQNEFVHAAAQIDAEAEAMRLGYYRNVRVRPV